MTNGPVLSPCITLEPRFTGCDTKPAADLPGNDGRTATSDTRLDEQSAKQSRKSDAGNDGPILICSIVSGNVVSNAMN